LGSEKVSSPNHPGRSSLQGFVFPVENADANEGSAEEKTGMGLSR